MPMNKYFAAFYSHFGAMLYFKTLKKQDIPAKLMPVPRKISSSCGVCVYYEHNCFIDMGDCELDSIYLETSDGLKCVVKK